MKVGRVKDDDCLNYSKHSCIAERTQKPINLLQIHHVSQNLKDSPSLDHLKPLPGLTEASQ